MTGHIQVRRRCKVAHRLNTSLLKFSFKMATGGRSDQLSDKQIGHLAAAISTNDMESIAVNYMDISDVTVKNIRHDASGSEAFNREIFHRWKNQNPDDQVKVSKLHYCISVMIRLNLV